MKIWEELSKDSLFCIFLHCRPEERFFFIYDCCMLQDQDDDITKSILYFDPKFVSVNLTSLFYILCSYGNL